jgi:Protein of unknown function (DUF2442)
MIRVAAAEVVDGFVVRIAFTDGTIRDVDLEQYLHGPVFDPMRNDPHAFRSLAVDPELGTIVWPNGADIDPDVLYEDLTPAWRLTSRP